MIRVIPEREIAEFAKCSMRVPNKVYDASWETLDCVNLALKQLALDVFSGVIPPLAKVRREIENHGLVSISVVRIARRLMELVSDYTIVHPLQPYDLHFGRNTIHGSYLTLVSPKKPKHPLLVRLRLHEPKAKVQKMGPDLINMSRWLHFRTTECSLPFVQVLNWSLDQDDSWMDFYDEVVARKSLDSLSQAHALNLRYPSAGPHCKDCYISPDCSLIKEEFVPWTK